VKKAADESGDYLTSALMDDYIESFYKEIWMLRQVLK
jgi:starvation-inducible DNA-binding protein